MNDNSGWRGLIPHKGAMCLLDELVARDDSSVQMRTAKHRDPHNPLRRDGRLHAVNLIEMGAQAMAVHGALTARDAGGRHHAGWLIGARNVELSAEWIEDLPYALDVYADRLASTPTAMQYSFRIEHDGQVLAQGTTTVRLDEEGENP